MLEFRLDFMFLLVEVLEDALSLSEQLVFLFQLRTFLFKFRHQLGGFTSVFILQRGDLVLVLRVCLLKSAVFSLEGIHLCQSSSHLEILRLELF